MPDRCLDAKAEAPTVLFFASLVAVRAVLVAAVWAVALPAVLLAARAVQRGRER